MFRGWLSRDILADEHYCATVIQSHIRAYLATMYVYEALYNVTIIQSLYRQRQAMAEAWLRRSALLVIQKSIRSFQARLKASLLHEKATVIQAAWRRFITHLTYQFNIVDIIIVQSVFRRWQALKLYKLMNDASLNVAVVRMQSLWRSYYCSMSFVKKIIDVIIVQSLIRRWLVIRKYKQLSQLRLTQTLKDRGQVRLEPNNYFVHDEHKAAIIIQKVWRGNKAQTTFVYDLVNIIISQVCGFVRILLKLPWLIS